ncbi:hypothetical protein HFN68_32250 [Rhizobium laguerreae]|uniref:hypothetical protein n=1 Tax=Rhizobium laguerreae TaxID=1076926 RepID=UPI001C906B51|nr:hypothetical protein [Rhizobium laguerreae]MBY3537518.1 hypothetical protein [Rhizobium laguerreae]
MTSETQTFLNLDGIPSESPRGDGRPYLHFDPQAAWRLSHGSHLYEIEDCCVRLHEAFKQAIMMGVDYSALVYMLPSFVSVAGHNSEAPVTRELFERFLAGTVDFPEINRFLYLYDCQHLVASIQECTKEVEQILGEFYLALNTENFFYPTLKHDDGTRYSTSPITTKLFAFLGFIFIRMHSLLDYTVKVAFEAEHLRHDFARYPKFSSSSLQFGDRKRVGFNGETGTLFETCEFMTSVETLRNHLIHDGLLDEMPKAYEEIKDGVAVEKFLLFPDMTDGRFDRFKNRNLFFGREDKINLRLPEFAAEFQARQVATLERILATLQPGV